MFTIHEIETENKLSVFPRFYAALASSIRSVCGDRGEGAVRQAIRLYAARQAGALCSAHKAARREAECEKLPVCRRLHDRQPGALALSAALRRSLHQGDLYMSLCPNLAAGRHVRCGQVVL